MYLNTVPGRDAMSSRRASSRGRLRFTCVELKWKNVRLPTDVAAKVRDGEVGERTALVNILVDHDEPLRLGECPSALESDVVTVLVS